MFLKSMEVDMQALEQCLVVIQEEHGCDANFAVSSLIADCVSSKSAGVQVVALHHSYDHYFHTCLRLGTNINTSSERIEFVEFAHLKNSDVSFLEMDLKKLLDRLKTNCAHLVEKWGKVWLIIDCVSDLLHFFEPKEIMIFLHYLRTMLSNNVCIAVLTQFSNCDKEQIKIQHFLSTVSNINLKVSPLKTGLSKEVSGSMKILNKQNETERFYHYKLSEKQVKIFPPGNI